MRVVRVYHAGRDRAHRERDAALARQGIDLTLVVPTAWPGADELTDEPCEIVELPVRRAGDVNRHTYVAPERVAEIARARDADLIDIHEEPFSSVVHQLLRALPRETPLASYAAQNIDKRLPPPFAQWERLALTRINGIYPCSRQAASVLVGKGYRGEIEVLSLGVTGVTPGEQSWPGETARLMLVGRLVPEKGVRDAVRVLARIRDHRRAELLIAGEGPELQPAMALARELGVEHLVTHRPWLSASDLANEYRRAHFVLVPSLSTRTWVEQFGRVVREAQANGAVVAAYASGALPEVLAGAGLLAVEGDHGALADRILANLNEPTGWHALRTAGLESAGRNTWDDVAAGQVRLYERSLQVHGLQRRIRSRRKQAVALFGPPAEVGRPFALPILRSDNGATRVLARAIDAFGRAELSLSQTA